MKILNSSIKDSSDPRIELANQITLAKTLFKDIQNLKKEEDIINKQRDTMEESLFGIFKISERRNGIILI